MSTLDTCIETYLRTRRSETSATNMRHVLESWHEWLQTHDYTGFDDIDPACCRAYAYHLESQTAAGDIAGATAQTYFAIVRAFLSFAVREEELETNPALTNRATEPLPEATGSDSQQFWSPGARDALLRGVTQRVISALEEPIAPLELRRKRLRDRALVSIIALSGVRAAEVFAEPRDTRRNGLRWSDVDFEGGSLRVLGKSRELERAPLPTQAGTALERYRDALEPPTSAWPVFPTNHPPTLHRTVREELTDDLGERRVERLLETETAGQILRDYEVPPPSLSTNGARSVLKRLCADFSLEVDGEYLKPHGARRGLGHELYVNSGAEDAQAALRHKSIETTHEAYSNIQAGEMAARIDSLVHDDE